MDLEEAALISGLNEDDAKDVYVRLQSGSIVRSAFHVVLQVLMAEVLLMSIVKLTEAITGFWEILR